jgi:hypothetical protein
MIVGKACRSGHRYTTAPLSFVIVKSKLWLLGKMSVMGWAGSIEAEGELRWGKG